MRNFAVNCFSLTMLAVACGDSSDSAGGADGGAGGGSGNGANDCDTTDPYFYRGNNDCTYTFFDSSGTPLVMGTTCDRIAGASNTEGVQNGKPLVLAQIHLASGDGSMPMNVPEGMLDFSLLWVNGDLSKMEGFEYTLGAPNNPTYPADSPFAPSWTFQYNPSGAITTTATPPQGTILADFGLGKKGLESLTIKIDSVKRICHLSAAVEQTIYEVHGSAEATTKAKVYDGVGPLGFTETTYSMKVAF